ncbi:MAG: c-type cytochrome [Deltaproteobacteria bacterium]|nr:c-type cytochrome [Kofleriaceae bacterium]
MRLLFFACALLVACGRSKAPPDPDALTPAERERLATLSPLGPVPPDPTNRYADDPRAARLGHRLFFDASLSGPGTVSCRTCHDGPALDDRRTPNHVSTGTGTGSRNTPPVLNASYYRWTNWGGRFDSQWSLVLGAIENPEVMGGARLAVAHTLFARYRAEYDALFDVPLDPRLGATETMADVDPAIVDRVFANAGKAVAAYMRTLVARDAPFDRYVAGDASAISPAARRGLRLFLQHCESCHGGPFFTDQRFHAIGAVQSGAGVPAEDLGRYTDVAPLLASPFRSDGLHSDGPGILDGVARDPSQRGQFRTPTLRNVAVTAPYMHAGQLADLAAVVRFYNAGGGNIPGVEKSPEMKRLGLTDAQQADLVAFLETLTDTALPDALRAPP